MKRACLILPALMMLFSLAFPREQEIVEKVSVEWWVVPIFAVDKSGQSVLDLHESDFILKVGNKVIENVTLMKKTFTASKQPAEAGKEPAHPSPAPDRTKNIFLIFDTALSTRSSTDAAKAIAQKIVANAEKETRFFVMTIEPFAGLTYTGGPTNDKTRLLEILAKKVKGKNNSRVPDPREVVVESSGKAGSKYEPEDAPFLQASVSKYYKRKSKSFAQAFESLYYAINTIKDNKFVYLFSEGISNAIQESDKGDRSMYRQDLGQVADWLGRSGSVLFIINPAGGVPASLSEASGQDSLEFLARSSGGKYLEGSDKDLIKKIEQIHQAYYEIFFPALADSRSDTLKISLQPKRQGIDIYTLHTTEKTRNYSRMKTVEQEVLALNLISGNPLYQTGVTSEKAEIKKMSKKKKSLTYQVIVPPRLLNRTLDLYKIWKPQKEAGQARTRVEKESLRTAQPIVKIIFKNVEPGEETYFTLLDGERQSALVHGMKGDKEEAFAFSLPPETEAWATQESMAKEKQAEKPSKTAQLEQLLAGVANYCEKLKVAAFHYTCKEKTVETQKPLRTSRGLQEDISLTQDDPFNQGVSGWVHREEAVSDKILSHQFNYRLIKLGKQVKEERDIIIPEGEVEQAMPAETKTTAEIVKGLRFVTSKAVFGPITLLAAERQVKYNFRLLEYEEVRGRRTAVLEAFPKDEKDSLFIYGKVWIDSEDFSVLKIKANPNSILGYERLRKFADQLGTRLLITLETDFFNLREGIRFPTRIHFEELYKGGPFISRRSGPKGWTRTETFTTYADYLFFDVKTDVSYK
jgi:hypothetical protein